MPAFTCTDCQQSFDVAQVTLDKYPGWQPRKCLNCKKKSTALSGAGALGKRAPTRSKTPRTRNTRRVSGSSSEENLTVEEVLAKYSAGPQDGVFTDGAAHPNPGPGGWGAVYVQGGEILAERWDHEPDTTNNRMELTALIAAYRMVPAGQSATVYTDSQLCVNTINQWAKGWERNGWTKKSGPIKNLELVQELYALQRARPELKLEWIAAHSGNRWNEYADALATAYRRSKK